MGSTPLLNKASDVDLLLHIGFYPQELAAEPKTPQLHYGTQAKTIGALQIYSCAQTGAFTLSASSDAPYLFFTYRSNTALADNGWVLVMDIDNYITKLWQRFILQKPKPTLVRDTVKLTERHAQWQQLLTDFKTLVPGTRAVALIAEAESLIIASALSSGLAETHLAGISATLLRLALRSATLFQTQRLMQIITHSPWGYVLLASAQKSTALLVLTDEHTELAAVHPPLLATATQLATVLKN